MEIISFYCRAPCLGIAMREPTVVDGRKLFSLLLTAPEVEGKVAPAVVGRLSPVWWPTFPLGFKAETPAFVVVIPPPLEFISNFELSEGTPVFSECGIAGGLIAAAVLFGDFNGCCCKIRRAYYNPSQLYNILTNTWCKNSYSSSKC